MPVYMAVILLANNFNHILHDKKFDRKLFIRIENHSGSQTSAKNHNKIKIKTRMHNLKNLDG